MLAVSSTRPVVHHLSLSIIHAPGTGAMKAVVPTPVTLSTFLLASFKSSSLFLSLTLLASVLGLPRVYRLIRDVFE